MSNRNALYWQKRAEQISNVQFKKADKLCKNIAKEYKKAEIYIQERINLYYARYAKEYGVDLADAKALLSPSELNNFKMTIEEFRKKAIENDDGRWTKELDEQYLRSRISRLEALKMDINNKIYELSGKVTEDSEEHLKRVYEDTYLRNITTYGDELGIGNNFERLNDDVINKAIYTRWTNEKNFAGRLDDNKKTLLSNINKTITQGLITGAGSDTMVEKLMKETKISRNRAINIVQTETTFIIGQANTQMYKDFGVEEYEIVETLDGVTCETCAAMDGKIGKVSEKVEGVNAPPFHPRCRGTTIPVSKYAEIWGNEQRIARDDKGDISYTNAKNYKEWKEKNNIKEEIKEHKIVNGKNMIGKFEITEDERHGDGGINRIMDIQGYKGNPKVVSDEEFEKASKESNYFSQRTYAGKTKEEVIEYQKQLYSGEWYVECTVGGSQYGNGMYCAATYDLENSTSISGITEEMQHYIDLAKMRKNHYSIVEDITLDKSAKIIEYNEIIPQYIKNIAKIDGWDDGENLIYTNYHDIMQKKIEAYQNYISTMTSRGNEVGMEYLKEYRKYESKANELKSKFTNKMKNSYEKIKNKNESTLAIEMGYDAINAKGHGKSGSYTVILNRTKAIIRKGGYLYEY